MFHVRVFVAVFSLQTVIAHALLGDQSFRYVSEVRSMDKYSLITRNCRDLQVKCIIPYVSFPLFQYVLEFNQQQLICVGINV